MQLKFDPATAWNNFLLGFFGFFGWQFATFVSSKIPWPHF